MENEQRMWLDDLFGKLNAMELKLLDRLEMNISLGNYDHIFNEKNPRVVA